MLHIESFVPQDLHQKRVAESRRTFYNDWMLGLEKWTGFGGFVSDFFCSPWSLLGFHDPNWRSYLSNGLKPPVRVVLVMILWMLVRNKLGVNDCNTPPGNDHISFSQGTFESMIFRFSSGGICYFPRSMEDMFVFTSRVLSMVSRLKRLKVWDLGCDDQDFCLKTSKIDTPNMMLWKR